MTSTVRIRLVPKTRDGRSIAADPAELSTASAKANRPDRARAAEARKVGQELGLGEPTITDKNSLVTSLPLERAQELFATSMEEATAPPPITDPGEVAKVDVNTASMADLERLPGVGPGLAAKIIEERHSEPFTQTSDLARVSGIGDSLVDELTPMVTTEPEEVDGIGEPRPYIKPQSALIVPPSLRDTIAFAYIPRPVEYFAATYIPPDEANYHLELQDVANALQAPAGHRNGWTGRGLRIGMADTGFAPHPYFERQGYRIIRAATPAQPNPEIDLNGHGTGESANALYMAPDCVLIGVKHNDFSAETLEALLAHRPDVMTNSWGWWVDHKTWEQWQADDENLYHELRDIENILNDAVDDGVLVAFSAGNGQRAFPACMPSVLAVGGVSVERDGSLKASNYASSFRSKLYPGRRVPDVCGVVGESSAIPMPGHIMLPVPDGSAFEGANMDPTISPDGWGIFSGTSASSPQVAGIAAMLLSASRNGRSYAPAELRDVLERTATDVDTGTTWNGDTAVAGPDDATGRGFVDAAEACALVANGTIEIGLVGSVTDAWKSVALSEEHDAPVAQLAAMQTFIGTNPAATRLDKVTQTGFRVRIEEEQSLDEEVAHVPENVGYLAASPGVLYDAQSNPIGEIQILELQQTDTDSWLRLDFLRRYVDPVVICQMMTTNGAQPAHTRLRNASPESIEIQIEEWSYLNGAHPRESITCLVVERGAHDLPLARRIEAGLVNTNHGWANPSFAAAFPGLPVVFSSCQTHKGPNPVVTRHRNVGPTGFEVRLQEEEQLDGIHATESVGWIAVG